MSQIRICAKEREKKDKRQKKRESGKGIRRVNLEDETDKGEEKAKRRRDSQKKTAKT